MAEEYIRMMWVWLRPDQFYFLTLFASSLLLWTRFHATGKLLLTGLTVFSVSLMILPISIWVARPLENCFPPRLDVPNDVVGAIVLGGAEEDTTTAHRGLPAFNGGGERLMTLASLAVRRPELRLAVSGSRTPVTAYAVLEQFGVSRDQLVVDADAANTADSAVNLRIHLATPERGRWLLVTSAIHMPRAVGAFRAQGWDIVPFPVDFRTATATIPPGSPTIFLHQLSLFSDAAHEWIGLLGYRVRGITSELVPRAA